mgnify:CR=1 FL=1
MNKSLIFLITVIGIFYIFFREGEVSYGPGVFAAEIPIQGMPLSTSPFPFGGYSITPLASFELKAKVLSKKNYSFGREADLSSTDLTLGWGRMSDEAILKTMDISQSNRWYHWQTEELLIPRSEISQTSANMHMIPADDLIRSQLKRVRKGDIVSIRGSLVRVDGDNGWRWRSSLTRNDTGGGACELVYVDSLYIESIN